MKTRFYTKAGLLTPYALSCGYIEKTEMNGIEITLERDSAVYAVRGYDYVNHVRLFWDCFEMGSLTEARRHYRRMIKKHIGQVKN